VKIRNICLIKYSTGHKRLIHIQNGERTTSNPTGEGDFIGSVRFTHIHAFTAVNLHLVAQVDMHRLDVGVVEQGVLPQLATDSALLETTEWHIGI